MSTDATIDHTQGPCAGLPADVDLERAAIRELLWLREPDAVRRIVTETPADAFTDPGCRTVWRALVPLAETGQVDGVQLVRAVQDEGGTVELAAGFLARGEAVPRDHLVRWFVRLRELAHRRLRILQCEDVAHGLRSDSLSPAAAERDLAEQRAYNLTAYSPERPVPMVEACARFEAYRGGLSGGSPRGVLTGLPELDRHGRVPPEYCLVLARSSVGKTAFALSLTANLLSQGRPVVYWTGEQAVEMLVGKLASIATGLSSGQVFGLEPVTDPERDAIGQATDRLKELPLYLYDGPKAVTQVWSFAAAARDRDGASLLVIDQFDKLIRRQGRGLSREESMAECSRELFQMQQDLGIPVLVLAQLGLKHQRDHARPDAWQVRDCSQLNQDADRIYLLDRPESEPDRWETFTQEEQAQARGRCRVRLTKNRNGIGGVWEEAVRFDTGCGRFGAAMPLLSAPAAEPDSMDGEDACAAKCA